MSAHKICATQICGAAVLLAACAHDEAASKAEVRQLEMELSNKPSLMDRERRRSERRRRVAEPSRPGSIKVAPPRRATCLDALERRYPSVRTFNLSAHTPPADRLVVVDRLTETVTRQGQAVRVLRSEGRVEVPLALLRQRLAELRLRASRLRAKHGKRLGAARGPGVAERLEARLRKKTGAVTLDKLGLIRDEEILARLMIKELLQLGQAAVHANGARYQGPLYRVRYRLNPPGCLRLNGSRFYTRTCAAVFETVEQEARTHPCLMR